MLRWGRGDMTHLNLGALFQGLVNLFFHDRPNTIHTVEEDLLDLIPDRQLVTETFSHGNTVVQPRTYTETFKLPPPKPFAGSGRRPGTSNCFVPLAE